MCASAEGAIRKAGGGEMLDKAKDRISDGVEIPYGQEKEIPDLATKGVGQARVGIKYVSKEGKRVDAEFAAIEFSKDGAKIDHATYNHTETADGGCKHLGDSTGSAGAEFIALKIGSIAEEVQAIIMCCYIFNMSDEINMSSFDDIKLVLKAAPGDGDDNLAPICHMKITPKDDATHTGITLMALYRAEEGKWKAKNVYSEGAGPSNDDMIPACTKLFAELGIASDAPPPAEGE